MFFSKRKDRNIDSGMIRLFRGESEKQQMLTGRLLAERVIGKRDIQSLREVEFKVFSQFGDDGIIQWFINNLEIPHKTFIEFGVEDYVESNTRFLLLNDNWSGYIMDGSEQNMARVQNADYYWRYDLTARAAFVTEDNVNQLIAESGFDAEIGLLHVDLDGNDYWIWKKIDRIKPVIVIMEYNSVFGGDRAITVPYAADFNRTRAHYSNLYFGASLAALDHLAREKGYAFVGSNSAGNNAYFVRRDKLSAVVKEISVTNGYVVSKYREARDEEGRLTFISGDERIHLIRGNAGL